MLQKKHNVWFEIKNIKIKNIGSSKNKNPVNLPL